MPECKWCKHFETKTVGNFKDEMNLETSCAIGKLNNPDFTDSCEAWELDQEATDEHDEYERDIRQEQEDLRRGLA